MTRLARALVQLRSEVDAAHPDRDRSSDGWIGDAAHRDRPSDHNPNAAGVVCAIDVTGTVGHALAERLVELRDERLSYVISRRRIASSYDHRDGPAWSWRPYSGSNPHDRHAHVSVHQQLALYDDPRGWGIVTDDPKHGPIDLAAHELPEVPDWAVEAWKVYHEHGLTKYPETAVRVVHRVDLAHVFVHAILPLSRRIARLEQQVSGLHARPDDEQLAEQADAVLREFVARLEAAYPEEEDADAAR